MSSREKKLLLFFAAAGFLVLNFLAFQYLKSQRLNVDRERDEADKRLEIAEQFSASREQVVGDMEWLAEHEPEPTSSQEVETKLQQLCEKEAKSAGLTIKTQKPQPTTSTEGLEFHRAKIQITVNGSEEALYRWFDRLNIPDQLRITTSVKISPNKEDDSKIDCTATVEQWFVPLPASA